jgi:hypothetical protein
MHLQRLQAIHISIKNSMIEMKSYRSEEWGSQISLLSTFYSDPPSSLDPMFSFLFFFAIYSHHLVHDSPSSLDVFAIFPALLSASAASQRPFLSAQ